MSGDGTSLQTGPIFGNLPALSPEKVNVVLSYCSIVKAVGLDGFSDTWIRNTKRVDLLNNLWTN